MTQFVEKFMNDDKMIQKGRDEIYLKKENVCRNYHFYFRFGVFASKSWGYKLQFFCNILADCAYRDWCPDNYETYASL